MTFKNRLALIDLTKREVSIEEIPQEIQTKYLGGRGINMYLIAKRFHPRIDPLGVCRFMTVFSSPHSPQYKEFSELIHLSSGLKISEEDLKTIGERICTLERRMLALRGIDRSHDSLPPRYFEPIPEGPAKGHQIDPIGFNGMLEEYYELHGWDKNGRPTEERMKSLEIPV